jgi:selenocysteine lyase/cysteine desulfurase
MSDPPGAPVRFRRLEPMPPAHPRPWFPTLPVLGPCGQARPEFDVESRFLATDALLLPSGKVATYWALRDAGVQPGDRVAVPAYHCPTMIHPIVALRASPHFVQIGADLVIGADAVDHALRAGVRAVVLPHYFGFIQPDIEAILAACRAAGVVLVEDCAHALYARRGGALPGSWGDYAIASTRKFIAGAEGGALVGNGRAPGHPRRLPGWLDELRGLRQLLAEALGHRAMTMRQAGAGWRSPGRAQPIGPADEAAARREAQPAPASETEVLASASPRLALRSVQALAARADHAGIAAVRRARYARWAEVVGHRPDVEAFAPRLAADQIPYVFPLRLGRPRAQFRSLKYRGIAVWRWDQLAESDCPLSPELAVSLVQMPCQHTLDDAAFEALLREFVIALDQA